MTFYNPQNTSQFSVKGFKKSETDTGHKDKDLSRGRLVWGTRVGVGGVINGDVRNL